VEKPEEQFLLGYFMTDEAGQEHLAGLLGFQRYPKTKRRHRGMVWGVYVSPAARGRGAARQLLRECIRSLQTISQRRFPGVRAGKGRCPHRRRKDG
jgi:ribosomal protein S18 acetylase RimI-like enzyme